jgi:hypothetical protein
MFTAQTHLVGKHEGRRLVERTRHRWETNILMDVKQICWEGVDWSHLNQDRDQRTTLQTIRSHTIESEAWALQMFFFLLPVMNAIQPFLVVNSYSNNPTSYLRLPFHTDTVSPHHEIKQPDWCHYIWHSTLRACHEGTREWRHSATHS